MNTSDVQHYKNPDRYALQFADVWLMQHTSTDKLCTLDAFRHIQNEFKWDQEEVHIIALNSRYQRLASGLLFRGTVDSCLLHPRDIFRFALKYNASAFILIHNHPSGDCEPSQADIEVTKKLIKLSNLMEIEFFDHLILSGNQFKSLREMKLFRSARSSRIAIK